MYLQVNNSKMKAIEGCGVTEWRSNGGTWSNNGGVSQGAVCNQQNNVINAMRTADAIAVTCSPRAAVITKTLL